MQNNPTFPFLRSALLVLAFALAGYLFLVDDQAAITSIPAGTHSVGKAGPGDQAPHPAEQVPRVAKVLHGHAKTVSVPERFVGNKPDQEAPGELPDVQESSGRGDSPTAMESIAPDPWDYDLAVHGRADKQPLNDAEIRAAMDALAPDLWDPDRSVRKQAITDLAWYQHAGVPLLGQLLHTEPDGDLRRQALAILAKLDTPASTALLLDAAEHDPLDKVREQADLILAQRPPLTLPVDIPAEQYLDEIRDTWLLPETGAVQALGGILDRSSRADIRLETIRELAQLPGEEATQLMQLGLSERQADIRIETLEMLVARGEQNLPLLGQTLLGDSDPLVRNRALQLLAEDGSEVAMILARHGLEDPAPEVREAAAGLLGQAVPGS